MSGRVAYEPGTGYLSTPIQLDGPDLWVGTGANLRGREWTDTLGYRSVTGISRPAVEATCTLTATSMTALDTARRAFDADMRANTPGTLVIDGAWSQRALVRKSQVQKVTPWTVTAELTLQLLDGAWRHELEALRYTIAPETEHGLNYPHNYPHNYGAPPGAKSITNPMTMPVPWRMTIWGPVSNPYVRIGSNLHQVDVTVPSGSRLEINSLEGERTVELIDDTGHVTNVIDKAHRGTGEDGGEYVFQPIPPGLSDVVWSQRFGFDITMIEEEMEPPWQTSS